MHCINHNVGDKPLVVICNVDTKPQGIPCLFSSDNLPAKRLYVNRGMEWNVEWNGMEWNVEWNENNA